MNRMRKLTLVFGTVGIAVGAGHIVQERQASADIAAAALAAETMPVAIEQVSAGPENVPEATTASTASLPETPLLPASQPVTVTAEPPDEPTPLVVASVTPPSDPTPVIPPAPVISAPLVDACAASLDLSAMPDATIGVTLSAPCATSTRVVLRHEGLAVAFRTLPSGKLIATLPALSVNAQVSARLPGGAVVTGTITVPEAATVRRIAVQWQADDAFQLIASNGSVTKLGDPGVNLPMRAVVFTQAPGIPAPSFEAEVTAKTCGRDLAAEMMVQDGQVVTFSDLTLAMPECDAVGDIVVLNNLLPDMTLAVADEG
jgi:hypothetical protein